MPKIKVRRKNAYRGPYAERTDKVKNKTDEEYVKNVVVHVTKLESANQLLLLENTNIKE